MLMSTSVIKVTLKIALTTIVPRILAIPVNESPVLFRFLCSLRKWRHRWRMCIMTGAISMASCLSNPNNDANELIQAIPDIFVINCWSHISIKIPFLARHLLFWWRHWASRVVFGYLWANSVSRLRNLWTGNESGFRYICNEKKNIGGIYWESPIQLYASNRILIAETSPEPRL